MLLIAAVVSSGLAVPAVAEDPGLVVAADAAAVVRGSSIDVDVLGNDAGPGGALVDPFIEIVTAPSHGHAEVVDADGPGGLPPRVRYQPALDAPTSDGLVYQLTDGGLSGSAQVTFTVSNAVPRAGDDSAQVASAAGATILIPVLDNDSDVDLGTLRVAAVTSPSHGTVSIEPGGVRYDPVDDYVGPDSFSYTVSDGQGGQVGAQVAVAVLDSTGPMKLNPDSAAATAGVGISVPVLANDSSGGRDPLTVVGASAPTSGGSAVVSQDRRLILYTSPTSFVGTDTFSYTVRDRRGNTATGQVTVEVTAPAPAPTAAARIPRTLDVGTPYLVAVTVTGFDATGAAAVLQRQAGDGWVEVGRGTLAATGGEVPFTPTTAMAGLRPRLASAPVRLRVLIATPGAEPLATTARTATVRASVQISVSGSLTRSDVRYSYRPGCPVPPSSLRRVRLNYWNYSGALKRGTLIVRSDAVRDLEYVFSESFDAGFRVKKMKPTDAFYKKGRRSPTASDKAAMRAGNTSAFNCRSVVGNPTKRSMHSYGVAIDINTFQNPYVTGSTYYPKGARKYLTRTPCRKGMICPGGAIATAMRERGWPWGARWSRPDYQHFSANGG